MARRPILEEAIMAVLWDAPDWLTPREVRHQLNRERPIAYTTVTTVLVRLKKKNRVERVRRGKAYAYRAIQTRAEYAALRMEELLHAAGDRSVALSHFIENLSLSERKDLQRMLGRE